MGKVSRQIVTLLEFHFKVIVWKGEDHILNDHFSLHEVGEAHTITENEASIVKLFSIDDKLGSKVPYSFMAIPYLI